MEDSILTSTKKLLGLAADYTAFDLDILTHLNAVFSELSELGIGPEDGLYVEDEHATWSELLVSDKKLAMVKTYIHLKVKLLFDPPGTSFLLEAMNDQIARQEWRLNSLHEVDVYDAESE